MTSPTDPNCHVNRRTMMRGAATLGLGAAATTMVHTPATAAPKKGGHLVFAIGHGDSTDTLDPGHVNNGFLAATHFTITNTLTEVAADGSLSPKLAESWAGTNEAARWTFKLRKGVTFHNGKDVTAADVIASINHHRGEDSKSSAKSMVDPITDIRADDPHTVTFDLTAGDADFPFKLSIYSLPIYPATESGSLDWASGVGCGGYVLKEMEPGVKARFERNPNYWQGGDRAHFDSAELLSVLDVSARQNALISGEVHGMDRVDLKTASRLAQRQGVVVEEIAGKTHYTFPMRTDMAPFDDANVRRALKYALDREAMLSTVLSGHGTIGNDHPISAAYAFAADLPQTSYDPDKSKHYLSKAGVSSLSIELSAADAAFAGAVDAAVIFREHAAKAGIDLKVVREPNDGYWSNVWMKKAFCACYWPGTPTVDGIFTQAYSAGASWNDTYWNHDRFNALLIQARAELDSAKRATLYHEMQALTRDEGGVIVPLFANDVFATSDKIGHGDLANNLEIDGRKFIERWWFA